MKPLRWFRLPVTEIALTVTLSLRFIPLVLEEVQNLVRSVQTRAINWKKLGFRGSAQVWLAVVERLLKTCCCGPNKSLRPWRCVASPAPTTPGALVSDGAAPLGLVCPGAAGGVLVG
jgi:hypothetical protein